MDCTLCQEIVSAHLDGEVGPSEWEAARAHLAGCAACRVFEQQAHGLHRLARLAPAEDVPDLSGAIVVAAGLDSRGRRDTARTMRLTLALLGLVQIALALPALLGTESGLPVHDSRHLGSFDVALAVGFLYAAWRPSRALAGVFPVAAALVACLVGTSLLDMLAHRTDALGELPHVPEVAGLVALWLLAPPPHRHDPLQIA